MSLCTTDQIVRRRGQAVARDPWNSGLTIDPYQFLYATGSFVPETDEKRSEAGLFKGTAG